MILLFCKVNKKRSKKGLYMNNTKVRTITFLAIGNLLPEIPKDLVHKAPSDGL